jgi:hypothetical protein
MRRADDRPVETLVFAPADLAPYELDIIAEIEEIITQRLPKVPAFY